MPSALLKVRRQRMISHKIEPFCACPEHYAPLMTGGLHVFRTVLCVLPGARLFTWIGSEGVAVVVGSSSFMRSPIRDCQAERLERVKNSVVQPLVHTRGSVSSFATRSCFRATNVT